MEKPEDAQPTPWVSIIVGVLVLACIQQGLWAALVVAGVIWVAPFVYGFVDERRKLNSPTGSLPKSSSILFWRRPRPDRE
jgi:hypothetical protein